MLMDRSGRESGLSYQSEASCHDPCGCFSISEGKMEINNLFSTQTETEKFYKQIKKFTLGRKEYKDLERNAIMDYRLTQIRQQVVPQPNFITFSEHFLFLCQQRISKAEAEALGHYLKTTGVLVEKRIHRLIIEQCSMTDESLSEVLDGIIG